VNNICLVFQARLFDEPQLAALCLKTIDKCTAEAIVAEGFTDIDASTLTLVLQRDTLRIKELHLFRAVCR
jgi:BTB/POZ domain-containing protein 1/2